MKTVIEMAREAGLLGPYDTEQDIVECGIEVWLSGELGMKTLERFAEIVRADTRNATLDEIATKIEAMPFGDTAASFAVWIREQKT